MGNVDILERLHALLRPRAYLQLGLRRPDYVDLARCGVVLVDPDPDLPRDALAGKPWLKLYAMDGDAFFAQEQPEDVCEREPLDLAVIDGVRSLSHLARDLRHIEQWSNERTCAVVFAGGDGDDVLSQYITLAREQRSDLRVHLVASDAASSLIVWAFDPGRKEPDGLAERAAAFAPRVRRRLSARTISLERALPPFALEPVEVASWLDPGDWEAVASGEILRPGPGGEGRMPRLAFSRPLRGAFRVELHIAASGMTILLLRCRSCGRNGDRTRDVHVDVERPGALHHELERVTVATPSGAGGPVQLELEGLLAPGEELRAIEFGMTDLWENTLMPAPATTLAVRQIQAWETAAVTRRVPFAPSRRADRPMPDKRQRGRRDAVLFAWWVPDNAEAEKVAHYYLGLLAYHHPNAKFFIGINHGTDPKWADAIRHCGLDVAVAPAPPEITVTSDAGGFLAALQAYERCDEEFDLLWFGHTKGASRSYERHRGSRLHIDHMFWARRDDVERAFAAPMIGLYAARYNLFPTFPWEHDADHTGWEGELDALRRVYRDRFAPLGLCAYETFFAMRARIVRRFCDVVGADFLRLDPREYGGDRWFFEMAFPSIASMQGYEPFIPMDVPGANDPRDDINMTYDAKQNHRLALAELARWRQDPFDFQPRVMHWDHRAWDHVRGF